MCSLAQYGSSLTLAMAKDLGNVSALKSPMTELAERVSALELGPATKVISEYQRRFWEPLGLSETRRSSLLRHAFSSSKHRWIRCTQRESLNEPVTPR